MLVSAGRRRGLRHHAVSVARYVYYETIYMYTWRCLRSILHVFVGAFDEMTVAFELVAARLTVRYASLEVEQCDAVEYERVRLRRHRLDDDDDEQ